MHAKFCSICGADNRRPNERTDIGTCTHPNVLSGSHYCIHCGEDLLHINSFFIAPDTKLKFMKIGVIATSALAAVFLVVMIFAPSAASASAFGVFALAAALVGWAYYTARKIAEEEALPPGWHDDHKTGPVDAKSRR